MDQFEGYEEFVAAHGHALSRTAYLLAGDHAAAQDLLQSALTKAAVRWRRIATNPYGYVRRTMYHETVSRWRRRRVIAEYATAEPPETLGPDDDRAGDPVPRRAGQSAVPAGQRGGDAVQ
ncbi:MAG: hypothetical protein ACRDT6_24700 [Micromonosporaceae bacterium]